MSTQVSLNPLVCLPVHACLPPQARVLPLCPSILGNSEQKSRQEQILISTYSASLTAQEKAELWWPDQGGGAVQCCFPAQSMAPMYFVV